MVKGSGECKALGEIQRVLGLKGHMDAIELERGGGVPEGFPKKKPGGLAVDRQHMTGPRRELSSGAEVHCQKGHYEVPLIHA